MVTVKCHFRFSATFTTHFLQVGLSSFPLKVRSCKSVSIFLLVAGDMLILIQIHACIPVGSVSGDDTPGVKGKFDRLSLSSEDRGWDDPLAGCAREWCN